MRGGARRQRVQGQAVGAAAPEDDEREQEDDDHLGGEQHEGGAQRGLDAAVGERDHGDRGDHADDPPGDVDVKLGLEGGLQVGPDEADLGGREQRVGDEHEAARDEARAWA